jgi:hypothetical protein
MFRQVPIKTLLLLVGAILVPSWYSVAFIPNPCRGKPLLLLPTKKSLPHTTTITTTLLMGGDWMMDNKGKPSSYSDNFLLDFHNLAQQEYQSMTNKLRPWNDELKAEQCTYVEWQDSFHRNGLSDFCPPMSSNLHCLVVGQGMEGQPRATKGPPVPIPKLPWEEAAEAAITSLHLLNNDSMSLEEPLATVVASNDAEPATAPIIRVERVTSRDEATTTTNHEDSTWSISSSSSPSRQQKAAIYDCIIDQGLMEAVLALDKEQAIHELSMEVATSLCEHGIYVLITPQPLTQQQQNWLQASGMAAGLEWEWELDGISDPQKLRQVVSVARRFHTGIMPKVGKLSRYDQV